jgi:hypothetical protein
MSEAALLLNKSERTEQISEENPRGGSEIIVRLQGMTIQREIIILNLHSVARKKW